MSGKSHYLCVFESKNHTLYLMKELESSVHKNFQLVSTPCGLKAGCSYSIKFPHIAYLKTISKKVDELKLEAPRIFMAQKIEGKFRYKEILIKPSVPE